MSLYSSPIVFLERNVFLKIYSLFQELFTHIFDFSPRFFETYIKAVNSEKIGFNSVNLNKKIGHCGEDF